MSLETFPSNTVLLTRKLRERLSSCYRLGDPHDRDETQNGRKDEHTRGQKNTGSLERVGYTQTSHTQYVIQRENERSERCVDLRGVSALSSVSSSGNDCISCRWSWSLCCVSVCLCVNVCLCVCAYVLCVYL